jgi:hypothetical protein
MGTEITDAIGIGLKWGLVVFLCSGLVYLALLRFRNTSTKCRTTLRVILGIWALLLAVPTLVIAFFVPLMLILALIGQEETFSQKIFGVAGSLIMAAVIVAAWWGLRRTLEHLERAPQPSQN